MSRLKQNIWAMILFWVTIISAVWAVASAIITIVGMNAALEVARQAALEQDPSLNQEGLDIVVMAARIGLIAGVVISLIITALVTTGGLKFSLQGKWGTFCIVIGVLDVIGAVITMASMFTNRSFTVASIVSDVLSIVTGVLFFVSSIMLRLADKKNA